MLRPFTAWLRQFEPATEVPDEAVFGAVRAGSARLNTKRPEISGLAAV
jgi:hypothetical protein